jgi:hypothetical protein
VGGDKITSLTDEAKQRLSVKLPGRMARISEEWIYSTKSHIFKWVEHIESS